MLAGFCALPTQLVPRGQEAVQWGGVGEGEIDGLGD